MNNNTSHATIAEYFRLGLMVGLIEQHQAVTWADSVIAASDNPSPEIIELAWSSDLQATLTALSAVPGERDSQQAGHWLLGLLASNIPPQIERLNITTQCAMRIAQIADLGEDTYYRFDNIDDELSLAKQKIYGTEEECRVALLAELSEFHPLQLNNVA